MQLSQSATSSELSCQATGLIIHSADIEIHHGKYLKCYLSIFNSACKMFKIPFSYVKI